MIFFSQANPQPSEKPGAIAAQQETEELKNAMIGAQESTAIQILLECCLPQPQDYVITPLSVTGVHLEGNIHTPESIFCESIYLII